jgi:nitrilase
MAIEGACFVLISTQVLSEENLEKTKTAGQPFFAGVERGDGKGKGGGGFAMIFGPDGRPLCEPLGKGEEGILTADVDLATIDFAKQVRFTPCCNLKVDSMS